MVDFYFDESGDFQAPKGGVHRCGVVCGVAVPETSADALMSDFTGFVDGLSRAEKKNGEPRGYLLTDLSRERFCDMLSGHTDVLVTPTTLDLTWHAAEQDGPITEHMKAILYEKAELCVHDTMREQMKELGRQWGNLSKNQALRLVALTRCFHQAITHSIVYHCQPSLHRCWEALQFTVDATHKSPLSREARVFEIMVLMWLCAWSKEDPMVTIEEIHTSDHPFVRHYCTTPGGGIDLGKMLKGNIMSRNSAEIWGLQVADICANIIYQAVHDLNDYRGRLPVFGRLMKNCPYGPRLGSPDLITVTGRARGPAPKFSLLCRVMFGKR